MAITDCGAPLSGSVSVCITLVLCVNQCQIAHIVFRDERPRVFHSISSQYRQASRKT
jgi:hypothetical protein